MSKAFMKEPDAAEARCPGAGCGDFGIGVARATVERQAGAIEAARLGEPVRWCPNPRCVVAYFDSWEGSIGVEALSITSYPKDPAGVLCACLGIFPAEIAADASNKNPERVRAIVAHAASGKARCAELLPSGRPCAEDARKLYTIGFRNPAH